MTGLKLFDFYPQTTHVEAGGAVCQVLNVSF